MTRPKRIALSGYYGFSNAGDEAVLAGLVRAFRAFKTAEILEITALSINPSETSATHQISAAHRYQVQPLMRTLAQTDLLCSGGGSLLQDVTSAHGIFYYLGVIRIAQILGKRTMFVAQGIGPLVRPRTRKLVASVANKLDAITVRDSDSAALLREIGVTRVTPEVTADPALLLGPTSLSPFTSDARFAVALRSWNDPNLGNWTSDVCNRVLSQAQPIIIPMQPQSDSEIGEQFRQNWHQRTTKDAVMLTPRMESSLPDLIDQIAQCRMVVGMRLHALILAAACGIPSVALSYDPKVRAFMDACGQSDAVYDLKQSDPDSLATLLARVWSESDIRSDALRVKLPALQAAARRNAEVALKLLG